jgi:hypothetical protein
MKLVTLQFQFEDEEYEQLPQPLYDYVFGEICQNLDFGFLVSCIVDRVKEEEDEPKKKRK